MIRPNPSRFLMGNVWCFHAYEFSGRASINGVRYGLATSEPQTLDIRVDQTPATLEISWAATLKPAGGNPSIGAGRTPDVMLDRAGEYTFTVTVSDGSLSDEASVTVNVDQTLSDLVVEP